jgi:hypothetical protein
MEDRKKFTYRYNTDTEKLLNEALKKYNLSSLNKLIDKLIVDALVAFPDEQKTLKHQVKESQDKFNKCTIEKGQVENKLNQLKLAIKQDFENKEVIKKLIA